MPARKDASSGTKTRPQDQHNLRAGEKHRYLQPGADVHAADGVEDSEVEIFHGDTLTNDWDFDGDRPCPRTCSAQSSPARSSRPQPHELIALFSPIDKVNEYWINYLSSTPPPPGRCPLSTRSTNIGSTTSAAHTTLLASRRVPTSTFAPASTRSQG